MDPDQNIDHRLAATTALRKSEDVRIMPPIERPPPPARSNDSGEEPIDLLELVRQRRERADRMQQEMAEAANRERLLALEASQRNGGAE